MATEAEYLDAARKSPSSRTAAEQALVDKGQNMQSVRNATFATEQRVKQYGS